MSIELYWLTLTVPLTAFLRVPCVLDRMAACILASILGWIRLPAP